VTFFRQKSPTSVEDCRLICDYCEELVIDPHVLKTCHHLFCFKCIVNEIQCPALSLSSLSLSPSSLLLHCDVAYDKKVDLVHLSDYDHALWKNVSTLLLKCKHCHTMIEYQWLARHINFDCAEAIKSTTQYTVTTVTSSSTVDATSQPAESKSELMNQSEDVQHKLSDCLIGEIEIANVLASLRITTVSTLSSISSAPQSIMLTRPVPAVPMTQMIPTAPIISSISIYHDDLKQDHFDNVRHENEKENGKHDNLYDDRREIEMPRLLPLLPQFECKSLNCGRLFSTEEEYDNHRKIHQPRYV
jgi:hypothetical protein